MLKLLEELETEHSCSPCHLWECPVCGKPFRGIVSKVESGEIKMCDPCQRAADFLEAKVRNRILIEERKAKAITDDLELAAKVKARDAAKKEAHEARVAVLKQNLK
jgi:hypothetical protein